MPFNIEKWKTREKLLRVAFNKNITFHFINSGRNSAHLTASSNFFTFNLLTTTAQKEELIINYLVIINCLFNTEKRIPDCYFPQVNVIIFVIVTTIRYSTTNKRTRPHFVLTSDNSSWCLHSRRIVPGWELCCSVRENCLVSS